MVGLASPEFDEGIPISLEEAAQLDADLSCQSGWAWVQRAPGARGAAALTRPAVPSRQGSAGACPGHPRRPTPRQLAGPGGASWLSRARCAPSLPPLCQPLRHIVV
eukprot:6069678-Pyramimonas_sp.AAC.1